MSPTNVILSYISSAHRDDRQASTRVVHDEMRCQMVSIAGWRSGGHALHAAKH